MFAYLLGVHESFKVEVRQCQLPQELELLTRAGITPLSTTASVQEIAAKSYKPSLPETDYEPTRQVIG